MVSNGLEAEGRDSKGHEGTLTVMEICCVLVVVVVTQLYSLVKTYQTLYLKRVNFNVCKLNLNKPELNKTEHSTKSDLMGGGGHIDIKFESVEE